MRKKGEISLSAFLLVSSKLRWFDAMSTWGVNALISAIYDKEI